MSLKASEDFSCESCLWTEPLKLTEQTSVISCLLCGEEVFLTGAEFFENGPVWADHYPEVLL